MAQTAISARPRHEYQIEPGTELVWAPEGKDTWRIRIRRKPKQSPAPREMLGFAKRFRAVRPPAE